MVEHPYAKLKAMGSMPSRIIIDFSHAFLGFPFFKIVCVVMFSVVHVCLSPGAGERLENTMAAFRW